MEHADFERFKLRFLEGCCLRMRGSDTDPALIAQSVLPLPPLSRLSLYARHEQGEPVLARRLLVHALQVVTDHESPSLRKLLGNRKGRKARRRSGYERQAKFDQVRVLFAPRFRTSGGVAVRVDLGSDPDTYDEVWRELGRVLSQIGDLSRFRITRIDVALDYPIWTADLLLTRRQAPARTHSDGSPYSLTIHSGKRRGALVRQYSRWPVGEALTRIEREYRTPRLAGSPLSLLAMQHLPDPFEKIGLRPMVMVGDLEPSMVVSLRLLQCCGSREAKRLHALSQPEGTSKKALRRLWEGVRAAATDPEALALVEQPSAAFERLWSAEARRVLDAILSGRV